MKSPLRIVLSMLVLLALCFSGAAAANVKQPVPQAPKTKRMIVLFSDESAVTESARFAKILHRFKRMPGFVCEVPEGSVARLRGLKGIAKVEEDSIIQIAPTEAQVAQETVQSGEAGEVQDGPIYGINWQVQTEGINAQSAWTNFNVSGEGIKIAILDTGVNYNLPEVGGYLGGYSFVPNSLDPSDHSPIDNGVLDYPGAEGDHTYSSWSSGSGHGTMVTSMACGKGEAIPPAKTVAGGCS